MNIGLYFGSFNPIHIGHLIIGNFIASTSYVDQVWFIPSPQNPLKESKSLLNEYHRKYLIEVAIEGEARLKCNSVEFFLPKPSYTINTLIYLQEKHRDNIYSIIMGSDSFVNIKKWKNYEVLLSQYQIIVYRRPGFETVIDSRSNIILLNAPLLQISATDIRRMIKTGESIRYLVPDVVKNEIEKNNYYR